MRGRVDLRARGARATCAPIVRVLVVVSVVCVAPLGAWAEAPVLTTTAAATEPGDAPEAILQRFSRPYPAPGSVPSPPSAARSKSPSTPPTPGGNITGPGHSTKDPNNSIDDADDRVPADQAAAIASTLPGVPIDPHVFARFGACTATHLGRGIFLTAGHCIDQQEGLTGFRSSPCPQDLLLYGDTTPRRCNVVAFGYDTTNDFALLEVVDGAALAGRPGLPVDYAIDWARVKKRWIRLFGYSRGQLRANLWCEANYDPKSGRLIHSCDTEGGDSGSALIDLMTGHVVGVHGGGLTTGKNYGFPIGRIPWAETLCVSVATSPKIRVDAGGAVGAIRVSTTHLREPARRLVVQLRGTTPRANTQVRVRGPGSRLQVEPSWMTWSKAGTWTWQDVLVLDQSRPGPWAVEVEYALKPKPKFSRGYVDGRIWVCP